MEKGEGHQVPSSGDSGSGGTLIRLQCNDGNRQLWYRHRIPGQQVRALHGGRVSDLHSAGDHGLGIAKHVDRIATDRDRLVPSHGGNRGQVYRDESAVLATSDAGTVEGRVGIVLNQNSLTATTGDNEVCRSV